MRVGELVERMEKEEEGRGGRLSKFKDRVREEWVEGEAVTCTRKLG